MKKLYPISLSIILLLSLVHISIARHYCGGELAATKISLSGASASCGMENQESSCPFPGKNIKSHCCDNELTVYTVDSNFTPEFSKLKIESPKIFIALFLPVNYSSYSLHFNNFLLWILKPPGRLLNSAVTLAEICVFRN